MFANGAYLKEYLEGIAREASRRAADNPYMAEARGGDKAQWHVLTTYPGHERIAAGHLIARRFGVYLPEIERQNVGRGRGVSRSLMFPGYVFLFAWNFARNWPRAKACTGISGILYRSDGTPAIMPDTDIKDIQATEWRELLATPHWRKRSRCRANKYKHEPMTITVSTKSYWDEVAKQDDPGRESALHKALGL